MKHLFWRKSALGNIAALFSGTAAARSLLAVTTIIIARQLGPEAYGQYSASLALVGIASVAFSLGLDGWLLYQGGQTPERIDLQFTSAFFLKGVLGFLWLVGIGAIAPLLNQASFPWVLVVLGAGALWLEEIARIMWSAFKATLRNHLTLFLMIIVQGTFLGCTLWLVGRHIQNPGGYMGARLLAALVGVAFSGFWIVRHIGFRIRTTALAPTVRKALPFAASMILTMIYGRADLTIVANELGSKTAGIYAPALTVTNTLFLIPAAVYGVAVPLLSRSYAQDRQLVKRTSLQLLPSMAGMGLGLGVGLVLTAQPLITLLYGPDFRTSGNVLMILSGVLALRCPNMALAAVLIAIGRQPWRVAVQAISAALNVLLNLIVVHPLGVLGVAKVYILTEAILLIGYSGVFFLWIYRTRATDRQTSF